MARFFVAGLLLIGLAGCAPTTQRPPADAATVAREAAIQNEIAFNDRLEAERRFKRVISRIIFAAAPLCHQPLTPMHALHAGTADVFPPAFQPAARQKGYGASPMVSVVVAGTPAAKAGLQEGDVLLKLNGAPLPTGKAGIEFLIKQLGNGGPAKLTLRRGETEMELTSIPEPACN